MAENRLADHVPAEHRAADGVDPERSPIFVVGSSRSGTTLLRMMLCAHPRIHLTMESSFYLWAGLYTRWRDQDGFPPYYVRSFSYRWLQLDPGPILAELPRPFGFDDRKRMFAAVMRHQASRNGKVRFGDKTPSHSASLGAIFRDFPDARVIRMVRDPREVVSSLVKMPWASRSLITASIVTDSERRQVRKFKDRILEVKLSALIAEPKGTMEQVLAHVGEDWSDQVLDHANHRPPNDQLPPMPWFESAARPPTSTIARSKAVDPVEVRLIEALNRASMRDQGLAPASLPVEPSRFAVWWRWARDWPEFLRSTGAAIR
ncbi:MAG: sulfotransferase, partial [Myxococcota bacterium]